MHVYGWPIWVKLAEYGWKNRRYNDLAGHGGFKKVENASERVSRGAGSGVWGRVGQRLHSKESRLYVEVLAGGNKETHGQGYPEDRNQVVMKWEGTFQKAGVIKDSSPVDYEWLRRHLDLRNEEQNPNSNSFPESGSRARSSEKVGARVPET
ncbi:hypothetical protein Q3G72_005811 [Acer saccharum]|nr:hypothetical protein Q3G72_005811 [Acer saccharum]